MNPVLRAQQGKGWSLPLPFRRTREVKEFPGEQAGWSSPIGGFSSYRGSYPRKLESFLGTYGGTEDSVTWVFACVSLVQQEQASYPYELLNQKNDVIYTSLNPSDTGGAPPDLLSLLNEPNEDMTYFDFTEYRVMDLELTGNSYWLMDDMNALGQPNALQRLRPELTKIAVNDAGRIIGYLYTIQKLGLQIPYDRDEVIHFKRPNPLDEYYGMGTVEAIQRSLNADLAQTDHVIGFFSDGARISGVLTTNTLSEVQFERFKEQFYEEYAGDANAHKILIAEEGTRFDPISQAPAGSGVVELRKMTKDEIVSGFGIHEFLLGGAGQSGVYKMEEAQHIFSRRMVPKARRDSLKLTRDLVRPGWGLVFRTNVTYAEPKSAKVERAGSMLKGGAALNESRHEMDLPPIDEEWANLPMVPQGFAPFGMMASGGAPTNRPQELPTAGQQPAIPVTTSSTNSAATATVTFKTAPASPIASPKLPEGYERIGDAEPLVADRADVIKAFSAQETVLLAATPRVASIVRKALSAQRKRVIRKMGFFGDAHSATRLNHSKKKRLPKGDMTTDHLWDGDHETALFRWEMYDALNAEVAMPAAAAFSTKQAWDLDDPRIKGLLDQIGETIEGINATTRAAIQGTIEEGLRRGYSVQQIANGVPEEGYPGVAGVFDEASESRAEMIARTETSRFFNLATLITYEAEGVNRVEVFDGVEWDDECRAANGSVWTIPFALSHPLEHPNCARVFAAVR